jgi:hypothetical protein
MITPDYLIKDRPIKQQQHILQSLILGLQSAFIGRKMSDSAKEIENQMLHRWYSLK